jgi:hypothetical protein
MYVFQADEGRASAELSAAILACPRFSIGLPVKTKFSLGQDNNFLCTYSRTEGSGALDEDTTLPYPPPSTVLSGDLSTGCSGGRGALASETLSLDETIK